MGMPIKSLHARFCLKIPYFDKLVISTRNQVRPVTTSKILNTVDTLFMSFKCEVRAALADGPDFNASVEGSRSKSVRVLGVEHNLHHIMGVPFKNLSTGPVVFPVPKFDKHIIGARQEIGQSRMHSNRTNIVTVRFECLDEFSGVVVVYTHKHVIGSTHNPLLASDPFRSPSGQLCDFKGFYQRVCLVIPNVNVSSVKISQDPRFRWMEFHPFNSVGALDKLALYI